MRKENANRDARRAEQSQMLGRLVARACDQFGRNPFNAGQVAAQIDRTLPYVRTPLAALVRLGVIVAHKSNRGMEYRARNHKRLQRIARGEEGLDGHDANGLPVFTDALTLAYGYRVGTSYVTMKRRKPWQDGQPLPGGALERAPWIAEAFR